MSRYVFYVGEEVARATQRIAGHRGGRPGLARRRRRGARRADGRPVEAGCQGVLKVEVEVGGSPVAHGAALDGRQRHSSLGAGDRSGRALRAVNRLIDGCRYRRGPAGRRGSGAWPATWCPTGPRWPSTTGLPRTGTPMPPMPGSAGWFEPRPRPDPGGPGRRSSKPNPGQPLRSVIRCWRPCCWRPALRRGQAGLDRRGLLCRAGDARGQLRSWRPGVGPHRRRTGQTSRTSTVPMPALQLRVTASRCQPLSAPSASPPRYAPREPALRDRPAAARRKAA